MYQFQIIPAIDQKDSVAVVLEEAVTKVSQMSGQQIIDMLWDTLTRWGLKVVAALLIYLLGAWIIRKLKVGLRRIMVRRKVELSLATFTVSFVNISLTVILFVVVVSILGVPTSTFAALLAAGGLAVGMALSGTLQNFAGGVMILLFKPFKVGDFIETNGYKGTVDAINITTTQIHTVDNRIIFLPNGNLANNNIENYSTSELRRVSWNITISYGDDAQKGIELLKSILSADPRVVQSPEPPFAALSELGDSALVLVARAWTNNSDYWGLYYDINKKIYDEFPKSGLNFPFPQMDVHILKD